MGKTQTGTIKLRPSGREFVIDPTSMLLGGLQKRGVSLESICGGKGTCGKCRVRFVKGAPLPSDSDRRHLSEKEIEKGWRLACQAKVEGDAEVYVPPASGEGVAKIVTRGRSVGTEIDPPAKKHYLELKPQTLENPIGDVDLIVEKLGMGDLRFDLRDVCNLPDLLRQSEYRITITVADGDITKIEPGDARSRHYGLAIDIGTSTLVVSVVDLNSGEERAPSVRLNPQSRHGADVISRIEYCRESEDGLLSLWLAVTDTLSEMIDEACEEAGTDRQNISETIVVGNPTMQHLFLALDPSYIGEMPYAPAICRKVRFRPVEGLGADLGSCPIQTPPNLSGFIGSDIVGGILSQGFFESLEIQLLVDLGTNAEIVLGNKERLLVSNAAAGPAFEGAKIECGMIGAEGAVDRLWFDEEDMRFSVIGDAEPAGICGSGLVDAVASLLDLGILDHTGKMASSSTLPKGLSEKIRRRLKTQGNQKRFWLSDKVYISQKDIRQVQAAKAAVAAGIEILRKKMGIELDDITRVLIAGAFGSYVNPASASRIGLIPNMPLEKIMSVGNSALEGAKMYLLSRRVRELADRIHEVVELHELSAEKEFMEVFVSKIPF